MRQWKQITAGLAVSLMTAGVQAQEFSLESIILESTSSEAVGGSRETANINEFFKIQKTLVFATLRDLGIDINTLPAAVQAKLQRYHTTNFEAFQLFSQGLDAQDAGRFGEAKELFQKAVALDPNFELAGELGVAMPDTNVTGEVQLQAVLTAASQSASSSGKTSVEVDVAGAIAALQAGQNVVIGESTAETSTADTDYTVNEAGSGSQYAELKVVGFGFTRDAGIPISVAATSEWPLEQVVIGADRSLESMGSAGDFLVARGQATDTQLGSLTLADASVVNWGMWQESSSGSFTVATADETFTDLTPEFQYMIGSATTVMPTTGTVSFSPAGGFLTDASGKITVNFVDRNVQLDTLGFTIGTQTFSNLQGSASYAATSGSGFFTGNYDSGNCSGCAAFSPGASSFTGNFLGDQADGLMFSTVLATGAGTASGVHAFTKD